MIKKATSCIALILACTFGFAQTQIDVSPDQLARGDTLEVEISGQNTNFGPATQTEIIFTQGTITNANTDSLRNITIQSPTLLLGTLILGNSFDLGDIDVIYEKRGREIAKAEKAFTVLEFSSVNQDNTPNQRQLNAEIYPNPFEGKFNLQLDISKAMHLRARVISASGKVVKEIAEQQFSAGEHELQNISLSRDLPSGMYLLKLTARDGQYSEVIHLQKN